MNRSPLSRHGIIFSRSDISFKGDQLVLIISQCEKFPFERAVSLVLFVSNQMSNILPQSKVKKLK